MSAQRRKPTASSSREFSPERQHEIANSLSIIFASVAFLEETLDDESVRASKLAECRECIGEIRYGAERILTAVRDDRRRSRTSERAPKRAGPRDGSRRLRVLAIDDDAGILTVVRRCLREHDVVALDDPKAALSQLLDGAQFDVIVCDLMMPDLTGMDVYERLAAAAPDQAAKMIFVTASATTNRARAFVAAMANRVLEKPFDVAQLRRVVRELGARDAAAAR